MDVHQASPPDVQDPAPDLLPQWQEPGRYLGIGFLIVGLFVGIVLLTPVFPTLLVGLISAILMDIVAYAIAQRVGGRYALITVLLYLLIVVLVVVFVLQGIGWANHQIAALQQAIVADTIPDPQQLPPVPDPALETSFGGLSISGEHLERAFRGIALLVLHLVAAILNNLVHLVSVLGMGMMLGLFVQLDFHKANGVLARFVTPRFAREAGLLMEKLDVIWGRFLLANLAYGAVLGVASYIQFLLMGVPFPLIMALLTGIISLIPSFGGLISNIVVFVPSLVLGSTSSVFADIPNWAFASLVFLLNVPITQASYYFFLLPAMSRAVQIPMGLVSVGVLLAFAFNSVMLAFLIVPILGTLRIFGAYILAKALRRNPFPDNTVLAERRHPGFFGQLYWSRWKSVFVE